MIKKQKKNNKPINLDNKKGITLIALVVTVIVLLILAGVTIATLTGDNGLLTKVVQTRSKYNKAQYYEEINIEIIDEQTERKIEKKDEAFIVSLNERLLGKYQESENTTTQYTKKAWVKNTRMYDDNFNKNEEDLFKNTILIIETTDNYEIYIYVNNYTQEARIDENIKEDKMPPTVTIASITNSKDYLFTIKAQVTITDDISGVDYSNCRFVFKTTNMPLGTEQSEYTDGIISDTGTIEKLKGDGTYYLHVLATDNRGNNIEKISENSITVAKVVNYDYATNDDGNGKEQMVKVLPGVYKFECWGAQGGNATKRGGYGGYSTGIYEASETRTLYINVGGTGKNCRIDTSLCPGGYNGGGASAADYAAVNNHGIASGGGATHIATVSGLLSQLESYKNTAGTNQSNEILIVAGGGAGGYYSIANGGDGGGISGTGNYAGTQTTGYSFGRGASATEEGVSYAGGGAGFYGGGLGRNSSAGGGSGYIGSPLLMNKYMAGFNVATSNEINTKTIKLTNETTQVSSTAETDKAKIGNGYVKITNIN